MDEHGKEWFVAKDVAEVLGYKNPHDAIRKNCKGVRDLLTPSAGGQQMTKFIPRSDVYRLITKSKLPAVDEFVPLDGEVREKGTHIMCTLEHKSEYSHFK